MPVLVLILLLQQETEAKVLCAKLWEVDPLLALLYFGDDYLSFALLPVDALEHAGVVVFQNQHAGQHQFGDLVEFAMHQAGRQTGSLGDAGKKALGTVLRE